jgi:plasmid stabilization system protein ParE
LPFGSVHYTKNFVVARGKQERSILRDISASDSGLGSRILEEEMPLGDKSSYTGKQQRQAEHIEEGYEHRGVSEAEAERRAWATVNKETGGGKKSRGGRGKASTERRPGRAESPAVPSNTAVLLASMRPARGSIFPPSWSERGRWRMTAPRNSPAASRMTKIYISYENMPGSKDATAAFSFVPALRWSGRNVWCPIPAIGRQGRRSRIWPTFHSSPPRIG